MTFVYFSNQTIDMAVVIDSEELRNMVSLINNWISKWNAEPMQWFPWMDLANKITREIARVTKKC